MMGSRWGWQAGTQGEEVFRERLHVLLQRLQVLAGGGELGLVVELLQFVARLDGVW